MRVALVGDSTIDNIVWVREQPDTVCGRLLGKLKGHGIDAAVHNFAADGFTTHDVLSGAPPSISYRTRLQVGDPFVGVSNVGSPFAPLVHLEATAAAHADTAEPLSHSILSIGGNDVRRILGNMHSLPAVLSAFHTNYPSIVRRMVHACPHTVLMLQYRPALHMDEGYYGVYHAMETVPGPGTGLQKLNRLMHSLYPDIVFPLARDLRLPIIDLSRSFDVHDSGLFTCQIEPSARGSELIATLMAHVLQHHDFDGPSLLYYATRGAGADGTYAVSADDNDGRPWVLSDA